MGDRVFRLRKLIASQRGLTVGLVIVVCVVAGFLVYREREALTQFPTQIKPIYLVPSAIFRTLSIFTQIVSWHLMLKKTNKASLFKMDVKVYMASVISRRIPGTIWHIMSRFALYPPEMVSSTSLVVATSLEFIVLITAGILIYLIFFPFYSFLQNWPYEIFLVLGLIIFMIIFIKTDLVTRMSNLILSKLHKPQLSISILRPDLLMWLGLLCITWLSDGTSLYFWVKAIVINEVPFFDVLGISTLSILVSLSTQILPAGFVLREMTSSSLLVKWMPFSIGLILTLGYRIGMIVVEILLVVITYTVLDGVGMKKNR